MIFSWPVVFKTAISSSSSSSDRARMPAFLAVFEKPQLDALDRAVPGDHNEVLLRLHLPGQEHCRDSLAGLQRQDIDNGSPPGGPACFGDQIALTPVDAAHIGEEKNIIMRRCDEKLPDKVVVLQILGIDAPAAALLRADRYRLPCA